MSVIKEILGDFSNINSFIGQKPYPFITKASIPYKKHKKAKNIPYVSYDNSYSKQITERLAIDSLTNQIKESYENMGFLPNVSNNKIVNIYTNGIKSKGFKNTPTTRFIPKINANTQTIQTSDNLQLNNTQDKLFNLGKEIGLNLSKHDSKNKMSNQITNQRIIGSSDSPDVFSTPMKSTPKSPKTPKKNKKYNKYDIPNPFI